MQNLSTNLFEMKLARNEPPELYKEDVTKKGTPLFSCMDHVGKMER